MAFCSKCGAQLQDGATFCASCGQPVSNSGKKKETADPGMPVFTPPEGGQKQEDENGAIPTFTPPTPTFEPPNPPKPRFSGPACYYHRNAPAAAKCPRCGKMLCRDCADSYGFTTGEYAGKSLCYDCTVQIWKKDEAVLQKNYAAIRSRRILCLVGVVIGAIVGIIWGFGSFRDEPTAIPLVIIGIAAIGGSFPTYIRGVGSRLGSCFVSTGNFVASICIGILLFFFWLVVYVFVALKETASKLISYSAYMRRTANYVRENNQAMQSLQDYMEYTIARDRNQGVDIGTLLAEDSKLADNSFAKTVQQKGEDAAEKGIRQQVAYINQFGEVVRNFAA